MQMTAWQSMDMTNPSWREVTSSLKSPPSHCWLLLHAEVHHIFLNHGHLTNEIERKRLLVAIRPLERTASAQAVASAHVYVRVDICLQ